MNVNDNLMKLNFRFERSKLLRMKLNWKFMKLNEEVTKMGEKTYIIFVIIIIGKNPYFSKKKIHSYQPDDQGAVVRCTSRSHFLAASPETRRSRSWRSYGATAKNKNE